MWRRSLAVIVGLAFICGLITGKPLGCEDEKYWCQNNRTAKQCGKEEYCLRSRTPEVIIIQLTESPFYRRRRLGWSSKSWGKERMKYVTL